MNKDPIRLAGTIALAVTLALSCKAETPASVDWESALAEYHAAKGDAQRLRDLGATRKPPVEEMRRRWDYFVRQHPDSAETAERAAGLCRELFTAEKWPEFFASVTDLVRRFPDYPDEHTGSIHSIARVAANEKLPADVRLAALRALVPLVKNRSFTVHLCGNSLAKFPLPPAERYQLARALEQGCGVFPNTRELLWRFLEPFAKAAAPDVARAECERFIQRYGPETAETRGARRLLLGLDVAAGNAEAKGQLAAMVAEDKKTLALKGAFADAVKSLKEGRTDEVAAVLNAALRQHPAWAAGPLWTSLLGNATFTKAPEKTRLALLRVLLEHGEPGHAQELAISTLFHEFENVPEAARLLIIGLPRSAQDPMKSVSLVKKLVRLPAVQEDAKLRLDACRAAVEVARRLEVTDVEVGFLVNLAVNCWDTEPKAAREALQRAVSRYPRVPAAAEAGWLLSFLDGSNGVQQGFLPRTHRPSPSQETEAPVLKLPPAAAGASPVIVRGENVELAPLNPKQNVLVHQAPMASASSAAAGAATDGDEKTSWKPATLPAALIVPVAGVGSIESVRVRLTAPTYFTVSLLDESGRVLARCERDWRFWEHFRSEALWPAADTTLSLLPVAGVRFVKLDLFEASGGETGVVELEAYQSPFAATAWHEFAAQPLTKGSRNVRIAWQADEPDQIITHTADTESARGFPIMRWRVPWTRTASPVSLNVLRGHLGLEFWGTSATLNVAHYGGAAWRIDGRQSGELSQPDAEKKESREWPLAAELSPGRHVLHIEERNIPASHDQGGTSGLHFVNLKTTGRSRVQLAVRFGAGPNAWGPWMTATNDQPVAIPQRLDAGAPDKAQAGAFFDSREVRGRATATLKSMKLSLGEGGAREAQPLASQPGPALPEQLDTVAELVSARRVVVVFRKMGTQREREAAQALADKAQVYLVPDDIGLNYTPGLVLAVGTPLRHRYCRQLLATNAVWSDPHFLNDTDGVVGLMRGMSGEPATLYVTGDTPDAVLKAAQRLLAKISPPPVAAQPFRVFEADTLEMVYPWQLRPERATPAELHVRLGVNDRRSLQFGIAAERQLDDLRIECSTLIGPDGATLPPPLARPVGNYEWGPFFGDLRLPNLLVDKPAPMPARTAGGVWFTALTDERTKAGEYRGALKLTAAGHTQSIPVRVTVEPIHLPHFTHASTFSFAYLPYWFHQGSAPWERALRELAADEAAQGVNTVAPILRYACRVGRYSTPGEFVVEKSDADLSAAKWQPFTRGAGEIGAGQALFLRFAKPVKLHDFAGAFTGAAETALTFSAQADGRWVGVAKAAIAKPVVSKGGKAGGAEKPAVLRFAGETPEATVFRVTSADQKPFNAGKMIAMTQTDDHWPFTADFAQLDRQMDIYEQTYREMGRPLPTFLCQLHPGELSALGAEIFDVSGFHESGCAGWFAEQLAAHLRAQGRLDRFILKVADEPRDIAQWSRSARPFHEGGLRTMTCHNTSYPDIDAAIGTLDPWCPNYQHDVRKDFFQQRRTAGDKVWWYICGVPVTRITGTPIENLPFYWLTAKWNFDGAMNYAALHAGSTSMPLAFRYEHGMDHRMVLLADGHLMPTTRRELEGDGIRDLKLIEFVRDQIAALRKRSQTDRAAAIEKRLDATIESVAPYRYGYPQEPGPWHQARSALYDLAVESAGK